MVKPQDLISRFTLDSATEFLFGTCVKSLESELPYPPLSSAAQQERKMTHADVFARAFSKAQDTIAQRGRLGYIWPWLEIFTDKTQKDMEIVDSFLNPILQQALENREKEKAAGLHSGADADDVDDDDTLLNNLVRSTTGECDFACELPV